MVDDGRRVLGPHLLLAPLADGGMGAVFLATQAVPSGPRTLSLVKTLKSGLASVSDYRPRFIDEMRVAVLLRHENLCTVFGGGESGGEFFLAMEVIEGVTFKRLLSLLQLRGHRLSTTQAAALAVGLLRGLHAAHTAKADDGRHLGVVHRDVSPHNVMVDVGGRIKVIDFGLATSVLKETFTESAVVLGKSAYMAPEQARGEDVDAAVDQYAAAIVLFELLTDDRFYGDMPTRTIWSVVGAGTHQPRSWSTVPEAYRPLLKRALSPRPADRFASCGAFADAIVGVDPFVTSQAIAEELGATVEALQPDELVFIATARAEMNALGAQSVMSSALTTSSASQAVVVAGASNRSLVAPPSHSFGQTESVSRSVALAVVDGDERETVETATGLEGPKGGVPVRAPEPARRPFVAIAAVLGVVVALGVIVAGGFVVRRQQRRLDQLTERFEQPVVAATPAVPVVPVVPVAPVAPVVPVVPVVASAATPVDVPVEVEPRRPAQPERARAQLRRRLMKLKNSCADSCVDAHLKLLNDVKDDALKDFEGARTFKRCMSSCS